MVMVAGGLAEGCLTEENNAARVSALRVQGARIVRSQVFMASKWGTFNYVSTGMTVEQMAQCIARKDVEDGDDEAARLTGTDDMSSKRRRQVETAEDSREESGGARNQ